MGNAPSEAEPVVFKPLPQLTPVHVPLDGLATPPAVIAFYCPGAGLTEWDKRTGGAPFGNFWPLAPDTVSVTFNNVTAKFANTEAAYQCMKWWKDDQVREGFEACNMPDLTGGDAAYRFKTACEKEERLQALEKFEGTDKYSAMLMVCRKKWALPEFKEFLLKTAGYYLIEHCEVAGRDLYWSDNYIGGGENRLGAALMKIRGEFLGEQWFAGDGWPEGVDRPSWDGGKETGNWQQIVDSVAKHLAQETVDRPLTAKRTCECSVS